MKLSTQHRAEAGVRVPCLSNETRTSLSFARPNGHAYLASQVQTLLSFAGRWHKAQTSARNLSIKTRNEHPFTSEGLRRSAGEEPSFELASLKGWSGIAT